MSYLIVTVIMTLKLKNLSGSRPMKFSITGLSGLSAIVLMSFNYLHLISLLN